MKIKVQPMNGGEPRMCSVNVEKRVKALGGKKVYGWATHDQAGGWKNREQHCVWESPEGELVDVTPRIKEVAGDFVLHDWHEETEFEPDPAAAFEGKTNPGYYIPPKDNPYLKRAADYMRRGDVCMYGGDLEGCWYWTGKANEMARKGGSSVGWSVPASLELKDIWKAAAG